MSFGTKDVNTSIRYEHDGEVKAVGTVRNVGLCRAVGAQTMRVQIYFVYKNAMMCQSNTTNLYYVYYCIRP